MKDLWNRINMWFKRKTYGSYGMDELSIMLYKAGFVLFLISIVPRLRILYLFGAALLFLAVYRCFSKQYIKRQQEREAYLKVTNSWKKWFSIQKRRFAERKTYKYFRCPKCKTYNRIPRGRGKIEITCPKCRTAFERKS